MQVNKSLIFLIIWFCCFVSESLATDFTVWVENFRAEAQASGISKETLNKAFAGVKTPQPKIISYDKKQPEFTQSVKNYIANRVGGTRIAEGRRLLKKYPTWLGRIEEKYKVQRRFLLALWGVESDYGRNTGRIPVINSLVTLAYNGRRSSYFRKELLHALHILEEGHISIEDMKGSWAGAMGQCQFMPSSFRAYAVDADGDGRKDIWNSVPDVLASTANYLKQAGWKDDQTWGRTVRLPKKLDVSLVGHKIRHPLPYWHSLGVKRENGRTLPRRPLPASLIMPDGKRGQAYLVYKNFRALLRWNRSNSFALSVGVLSDRLASGK